MQKEISSFVRVSEVLFNQNMNSAPPNCSYVFYLVLHQHNSRTSENSCTIQSGLMWVLLVLSDVVYFRYNGNLPTWWRTVKSLPQVLTVCLVVPNRSAWSCPSGLKRGHSNWQVCSPRPCREQGGKEPGHQACHLWKLEHMAPWNVAMVRCRAKGRLELVNPNCKVLCHALSPETGGLPLRSSTGKEQISNKAMVLYGS